MDFFFLLGCFIHDNISVLNMIQVVNMNLINFALKVYAKHHHVTSYSLLKVYQLFKGLYCLHIQVQRKN
jgi:hypothetical protein